jgi:LacI family transcriptional regulator
MTETDNESSSDAGSPRRPHRPAPTIYDIAELAGVNPSTVSRALSNPGRISAKTEKLIQDAAKTLNYRVNPMARALLTGRTQTLGLIIADFTNPMFFEVVRGAERAAAAAGYTLIVAESQESGERETEAAERVAPSVDALILAAPRLGDEQIEALAATKPLVVVNRRVDGVEGVVPDVRPGIVEALAHLSELGHTSVAYLRGPDRSWMSGARWDAMLPAALEFGMTIVEIGPGGSTLESGRQAIAGVLASGATAVIGYNDLMAIGLLRAAQEQHLQIPGRLSIIGFDDIFGSDFTSPALTTIRMPLDLMGEMAVQEALRLAHGAGRAGQAIRPGPELATTLLIRGSTGPVER